MNDHDFDLLALRYLDGIHSQADAEQLAEQLASDPAKRDRFAALSVEMGLLREMSLAAEDSVPPLDAVPTERVNPGIAPLLIDETDDLGAPAKFWSTLGWIGTKGFALVLVLFAGTLLVGGIIGWLLGRDGQSVRLATAGPGKADPALSVTPVAYLTSANGCDWGSDEFQTWTVGHRVEPGSEITLHEGIAEFRLGCGVSLSIEGPAALVMASPTSLVLQQGKLTVHVPWEATDFRLIAGACRLTASDAEFGIDMTRNRVEVHAFSGEVQVFSSPFTGKNNLQTASLDEFEATSEIAPTTLTDGQAVLISEDSEQKLAASDRSKFATKLSMGGILPVTDRYVKAVLNSRPIGYWRFESIDKGQVTNQIKSGPSLTVHGEVVLAGNKENHVAELGRLQAHSYLVSDGPVAMSGDYAVELWMKPSHYHRGVLAALTIENHDPKFPHPEKHGFMLETLRCYESKMGHPGSIRFLHRNPPGVKGGNSCYSSRLYNLRRWQHVVAVKHKTLMRLYLDGEEVAVVRDSTPLADGFHLVVGRTFAAEAPANPFFIGQIDELAIYDRAMGPMEVKSHWKTVEFGEENPSVVPDI